MAFEDDVVAAKASGRPFRTEHSREGSRVIFLTPEELAEVAARRDPRAEHNDPILRQLAAIDAASGANRGIRELALSFGALVERLRQVHPDIPSTADNVGMIRIGQAEAQARALRAQLIQ